MAREITIERLSVASGGHAAVESAKISQNKGIYQGTMVGYIMTINNCTNVVNGVLAVKHRSGQTLYTGAAHARGATYVVTGLTVPLYYGETITFDPSADPGASGIYADIILLFVPDAIV